MRCQDPNHKDVPPHPQYIQEELASTIAGECLSFSSPCFRTVITKKGRSYHPGDYANVLYAKYSRAVKSLVLEGKVRDYYTTKGMYRRTRAYGLVGRDPRTGSLQVGRRAEG